MHHSKLLLSGPRNWRSNWAKVSKEEEEKHFLSYLSTLYSRFSYTVTITIKDVSISATASKKKDAKNLAFKNMAIRLEDNVSFWFRSRKNN